MNETEIREKLSAAFGPTSYPPDLVHRVASRLDHPRPGNASPPILGLVAALLALAIVATLVLVRLQSAPRVVIPTVTPPVQRTPNPEPPRGQLPQADLDGAQLSGADDLVTPFNLTSTSNNRTVTLIGAYADHARTVVFFRTVPPTGYPNTTVDDDAGFLNASSTSGQGSLGDTYFVLDTGPHAGADGVAHLTVTISSFDSVSLGSVETARGNWTFAFALKLQGSNALTLSPALTSVGTWKFTVEAMEVTSTLIHFQAVIDGAAVEDIGDNTVSLSDATGNPVRTVGFSAGTTVPKSQVTSTVPRSTRVNITWARPAAGGNFILLVNGGGSTYRGTLAVPAPPPVRKGAPLTPTDYPASPESLRLVGAISDTVTTGDPTECGSGTGPSGTVFAFGTYFQIKQVWYLVVFSTDPTVLQYRGPGTYPVRATIFPYSPYGSDPIFAGTVQLTVTSDRRPGTQNGSVNGMLNWTGPSTQSFQVLISGNWTCTWSQELGPG